MKKRKFTLIEILIVVAIIAILAGMLLPAQNRARMKAHAIRCAGNQKQLAFGLIQYAAENRDYFPHIPNPEPTAEPMLVWDDLINAYAPGPVLTQKEKEARFVTIKGSANLYLCPADKAGPSSYGANYYRRTYALTRGTGNSGEYNKYPGLYGAGAVIKSGMVKFPSRTFSLVEIAIANNTLGYTSNASVQNAKKQWEGDCNLHGPFRYNYGYVDGHVALKDSREGDPQGERQYDNRSSWNARRARMQ